MKCSQNRLWKSLWMQMITISTYTIRKLQGVAVNAFLEKWVYKLVSKNKSMCKMSGIVIMCSWHVTNVCTYDMWLMYVQSAYDGDFCMYSWHVSYVCTYDYDLLRFTNVQVSTPPFQGSESSDLTFMRTSCLLMDRMSRLVVSTFSLSFVL